MSRSVSIQSSSGVQQIVTYRRSDSNPHQHQQQTNMSHPNISNISHIDGGGGVTPPQGRIVVGTPPPQMQALPQNPSMSHSNQPPPPVVRYNRSSASMNHHHQHQQQHQHQHVDSTPVVPPSPTHQQALPQQYDGGQQQYLPHQNQQHYHQNQAPPSHAATSLHSTPTSQIAPNSNSNQSQRSTSAQTAYQNRARSAMTPPPPPDLPVAPAGNTSLSQPQLPPLPPTPSNKASSFNDHPNNINNVSPYHPQNSSAHNNHQQQHIVDSQTNSYNATPRESQPPSGENTISSSSHMNGGTFNVSSTQPGDPGAVNSIVYHTDRIEQNNAGAEGHHDNSLVIPLQIPTLTAPSDMTQQGSQAPSEDVIQLKQTLVDRSNEVIELMALVKSQQEDLSNRQHELSEKERALANLQRQLSDVDTQQHDSSTKQQRLERTVQQMTAIMQEKAAEFMTMKSERDGLRVENEALAMQNEALRDEVETAQAIIAQLSQRESQLTNELSYAQQNLSKVEQEMRQAQEQQQKENIKQAQSQTERAQRNAEEQNKVLMGHLEKEKREREAAQREVVTLKSSLSQLEENAVQESLMSIVKGVPQPPQPARPPTSTPQHADPEANKAAPGSMEGGVIYTEGSNVWQAVQTINNTTQVQEDVAVAANGQGSHEPFLFTAPDPSAIPAARPPSKPDPPLVDELPEIDSFSAPAPVVAASPAVVAAAAVPPPEEEESPSEIERNAMKALEQYARLASAV